MRDAQGHELSGATIDAIDFLDRAVRAFISSTATRRDYMMRR